MTPAVAAAGLYCGLNALILVWLMVATIRVRFREKIVMGDGGNPRMVRMMRGHANAVEAIPAGLVLILALAVMGAPALLVHLLGSALTLGRIFHGLHFTAADAPRWQRAGGTILTLSMLIVGAVAAIGYGLARM